MKLVLCSKLLCFLSLLLLLSKLPCCLDSWPRLHSWRTHFILFMDRSFSWSIIWLGEVIWRLRAGTVGKSYMGMLLCNTPGCHPTQSLDVKLSHTLVPSQYFTFKYLTHPLVHRNTILLSKVAKASVVSPSVQCLSIGVMVLMGLGVGVFGNQSLYWQDPLHSSQEHFSFLPFSPAWANVTVKTGVGYFLSSASTIP